MALTKTIFFSFVFAELKVIPDSSGPIVWIDPFNPSNHRFSLIYVKDDCSKSDDNHTILERSKRGKRCHKQ